MLNRRSATLLLLLASGCNQIYGLERTQVIDAAYFDAPPSQCPPLGQPPMFTDNFEQAVFQPCIEYTFAENGRALARCGTTISEGMKDGLLVDAVGFESSASTSYDHPRIHPDGDHAIVRMNIAGPRTLYGVFERTDGGWVKREEIAPSVYTIGSSGASRDGRVLVMQNGGMHEWARADDGTWSEIQVHSFTQLQVNSLGDQINLSADGLRVIYVALPVGVSDTQLVYSDRPTTADLFSPAVVMPSLGYLPSGFMTEDCSRLYFGALGNVFFTEQAPRM